eukprot:TRINITY_DN10931_c0_g1_i11.p2 TRINITY_DN10931_c0_g1~~TRINITY_DN10931_c0_g1_i11.p2  ORF type:complete len:146 (-),score=17.48 TRINITY_DN10931_c0_g1_i11:900-1337(-)
MSFFYLINDIDQVLYPPGFSREEYSKKNMVGNVFLRNCHAQDQFQIGALRKEFTKPELLIADNLWKSFSHALRVEAKQSIIAMLRKMRQNKYPFWRDYVQLHGKTPHDDFSEMLACLKRHQPVYKKAIQEIILEIAQRQSPVPNE